MNKGGLLFVFVSICFLIIGFNEVLYLNNIEKSFTGIMIILTCILYGYVLGGYGK